MFRQTMNRPMVIFYVIGLSMMKFIELYSINKSKKINVTSIQTIDKVTGHQYKVSNQSDGVITRLFSLYDRRPYSPAQPRADEGQLDERQGDSVGHLSAEVVSVESNGADLQQKGKWAEIARPKPLHAHAQIK